MGIAFAAMGVGSTLLSPALGKLADTHGRRCVLFATLAVSMVASFCTPAALAI